MRYLLVVLKLVILVACSDKDVEQAITPSEKKPQTKVSPASDSFRNSIPNISDKTTITQFNPSFEKVEAGDIHVYVHNNTGWLKPKDLDRTCYYKKVKVSQTVDLVEARFAYVTKVSEIIELDDEQASPIQCKGAKLTEYEEVDLDLELKNLISRVEWIENWCKRKEKCEYKYNVFEGIVYIHIHFPNLDHNKVITYGLNTQLPVFGPYRSVDVYKFKIKDGVENQIERINKKNTSYHQITIDWPVDKSNYHPRLY